MNGPEAETDHTPEGRKEGRKYTDIRGADGGLENRKLSVRIKIGNYSN